MLRTLLSYVALIVLAGCATAGPIEFDCPNFDKKLGNSEPLRQQLPPSKLDAAIQEEAASIANPAIRADAETRAVAADRSARPRNPLAQRLEDRLRSRIGAGFVDKSGVRPRALLLSGGGQWGAFGAGYLDELRQHQPLPKLDLITGVSTGALQSLFVGLGTEYDYRALVTNYEPQSEKNVVDRHWQPLAALLGSIAGLKPLRERIETALCDTPKVCAKNAPAKGDEPIFCAGDRPCMVQRLKTLDPVVLIGFIEAESGEFYYVDVADVANRAGSPYQVTQCLAGAALASAAMPVFFQQVRINGKTYYDGGVRQSVFEDRVAGALALAAAQAVDGAAPPPRDVYVLRNGPTRLPLDEKQRERRDKGLPEPVNAKADAVTAAERAEAILVNELEVGSIAALRLEHPRGNLLLTTADGWDRPFGSDKRCPKPAAIMFDRDFMACLQRLGRLKARNPQGPWRTLPTLDELTKAAAQP